MTNPTVAFRLKPEVYLKLEAIAAESGQTPGGYLKRKLETDTNSFITDLQLMKIDMSEILELLQSSSNRSEVTTDSQEQSDILKKLLPIVLESLLILREVGAPNKVASAQKLINKAGIEAYNSLEN